MIRDAVIHVINEQPLLVDIFSVPTSADAGLVCTNVRTVDGHRPIFIDRSESIFFFPYLVIRFIEFSQAAMARHIAEGGDAGSTEDAMAGWTAEAGAAGMTGSAAQTGPTEAERAAADADIEIDEGFLKRIRDI